MTNPACRICNDTGIAGTPDFAGDKRAVTLYFCDCLAGQIRSGNENIVQTVTGAIVKGDPFCLKCGGAGEIVTENESYFCDCEVGRGKQRLAKSASRSARTPARKKAKT